MHPQLEFSETSHRADVIFVGTVTDISTRKSSGGRMVFTDVTFGQIDLINRKEHVPEHVQDKITLTFGGGEAEGLAIYVSGAPSFEVGQRCLIFALYDGRTFANPLVGGTQGLFRLTTDPQTGESYPLTAGKSGIVSVNNGRLKKLSRVEGVRNGQIQRRARRRRMMTAPRSADKSAIAITAKEPPLPDGILSLEEFITGIYETLAGPAPANPRLRIKDRSEVPVEIYPKRGESPTLQNGAKLPRKGLVPKGPDFLSGQGDSVSAMGQFNSNTLYSTESGNSDGAGTLGSGTDLGYCGYVDLPFVMEQVDTSWQPWYDINEYCMWFYNQVMNIYEFVPSDGMIGDNDENELWGFASDARLYRIYEYHYGSFIAMAVTTVRDESYPCREIIEADIMFNSAYTWDDNFDDTYNNSNKKLYRPVMMHELAHSWGMQRGNLPEDYSYGELSVMHAYYSNLVEDGYGIHAVDAWAMRGAYDDQTIIWSFPDMGVESYWADNGLHESTTDKRVYTVGEPLTIDNLSMESMSHTTVSNVQLSIYLSADDNITTSDYKLGDEWDWDTFPGETVWQGDITYFIPDHIPPGHYYVGAIVYLENDVYSRNNRTYLTKTVEIKCPLPDPPGGVSATDETYTNRVRITWDSVYGIPDYELWRNTSNSSASAVRIASGITAHYFDDFTGIANTTYYYWVKSRNNCGTVSGFSAPDSGYRAMAGSCQIPPDGYDHNIIPSIQRQTIQGGFLTSGCRVYRMHLYPDAGYDFSVCSQDGMGGWFSGDGDGDLTMYDPDGDQLWFIPGFTDCDRDATTIGTVAYDNWSPPTEGDYYLKVSEGGNNQPAGFNLAYRATSGDYCRQPPSYNRTLYPEPYWQVTDSTFMLAGACRIYRIFMSADAKYDFTLCSQDDVGASWTSYTDGDLVLYNSAGNQVILIDGEAGCRYDASTLGTIYEGLSPPSDDYYYLKVITHSQNFDATFRMAYKRCTMPADPVVPAPFNEASDISLDTNLSWLGILDDFDRPFNYYMGRNWIERSGDFWIAADTTRGNNNSLMTFNGVSGNHIGVDARKTASELGYVALVTGYADQDNCIFVKIQGSGEYNRVYFFFGANGQNNAAWSGQTMYTINKTFTSARISTHLEGDKITLEIDTDFDGNTDQTFSRSGVPLHLLGDGIGLGVYGLDSMDNFALTGPAATPSSNSKGDVIDSSSFCYDLGHPTFARKVADIGSSDRGIAVDINQTVEVSALAIKAVIGFKNNLTVKIRQVNSTSPGPILASATTPVSAGPLDFYEVPIDFTFQDGLRYDISFNVTGGWGKNGNDQLEYYQFNNPTLNPASGFDVGSFKVLDGRTKLYSDINLPHIRACLAQPCPTTWDLYFGTENPPETLVATNLTGPFYDPTSIPNGLLNSCTTYYWRTVKKNCCGEVEGPVWSFTTGDTPPFDPYPEDESVDVSVHSSLMWSSGAPASPVGGGSGEPVEILRNPGFESGNLSPWYTGGSGTWTVSSLYLHSGNYNAYTRDVAWIQQDFPPVAVADIYTVNLWSRQPGKNKKTAVEFYYQDGTSNYVLISTSGTWRPFDVTSGLETNKILTGLRIWDYGADGIDDLTNIDDVSIIAKNVPCQTTYNVYMGTKNPPHALIASGLTEPSVDPTPQIGDMLRSCDTYYWQVETNNCCGQTLTTPVWSFRTGQLGDLDGTRSVSLGDFAVFASRWLDIDCTIPDWCNAADIDHSGENDQTDLSLLVEQWLRTCP